MAIDISNRPEGPIKKAVIHTNNSILGPGVSSDFLKMLAIIAMTVDHMAWVYIPSDSFFGQLCHFLGQLAAPIMCFFIAEGYYKTRNIRHYALRLGIFALISHIPFVYFETRKFIFYRSGESLILNSSKTSVMFTLFIGLIVLIIQDNRKLSPIVKMVITALLCAVSIYGEWGGIGVVWIIIFGNVHNRMSQIKLFSVASGIYIIFMIISDAVAGCWYADLYQLGIFLSIPLIWLYNGVRNGGTGSRWFFYIYYPVHMVFLVAIYPVIFNMAVKIVHGYASMI